MVNTAGPMTAVPKPQASWTLLDTGALVSFIIIVCEIMLCGGVDWKDGCYTHMQHVQYAVNSR